MVKVPMDQRNRVRKDRFTGLKHLSYGCPTDALICMYNVISTKIMNMEHVAIWWPHTV